jgi:hypothetical protein
MHHGKAGRYVRMGIALGGHAMRGPARVGDAVVRHLACGLGGEFGDAADAAQARQRRIEQARPAES